MQATIHTPAVYSQAADPAAVPPEIQRFLPTGWQLSAHQLATHQALCNPNIDIVINSAMTGDGKSLAGQLPYLTGRNPQGILALYPTNELIRDQERSAHISLQQWQGDVRDVTTLYGARLDELVAQAEELKRPGVLERALKQHPLVLTNPDILHAILQFAYQQYGRESTNILSMLRQSFQQFTFDEFHIFDTAQVTAVLIGLLLLYETTSSSYPLKTLFLSATPRGLLLDTLKQAGFDTSRITLIEPQREGWYSHGDNPGTGWRRILQQSSISFTDQKPEDWVPAAGATVLLEWFRTHGKGAKAALIVNSVARALRLTAYLKPILAAEGLEVRHNTGMTGREDRQVSYNADLLIATSTVDVGVDFHINLLIFEASDAGTFLQRLGRLGRHTSYIDRNGNEHRFEQFAAYALVPSFVVERLFTPRDEHASLLADGASITREALAQHIYEEFPSFAEFRHYARHWGRFQAAKVYATLSTRNNRETFADTRQQLKQRYSRLLQTSLPQALRDWEEYHQAGKGLLINEAQSFRGGSPLDCAVLQKSDAGRDEVVTYDLLSLLANFQLEPLDHQIFCTAVKHLGESSNPYTRTPPRQIAYFRRLQQFDTFQEVTVVLPPAVSQWGNERYQTAQVVPGFELDCRPHAWLGHLNRRLLNTPMVALLVRGWHPLRLRSYLKLPGTFRLQHYRFRTEGQIDGAIAFGREALLLDSRLRSQPLEMPGSGAILC